MIGPQGRAVLEELVLMSMGVLGEVAGTCRWSELGAENPQN